MEEVKKDPEKQEKKVTDQGETPPKKWKKITGWILTALLIVFLVVFAVTFVQAKITRKPAFFGYAVYYVVSGSMEPVIHVGDVIVDEKVDSISDLKVGDIITYYGKEGEFAGKTVTHQIVRIEGEKIVTKGVSVQIVREDPAITFDDVIGRYVKTSAFLTKAYSMFTNKFVFFFIVFVPLIILLIVQIVNFRRACRMDKDGNLPEEKSEEEIKAQAVKEKEDEIKRKAVEEYLASKKRIEEAEREKNKK